MLRRGGTDTGGIQRMAGGCKALTISLPTRYIHTVAEMINVKDLRACRDLLAAYLTEAR
jgi:putative aminopeptidase FrvX